MNPDSSKKYPVILTAGDKGRARPVFGMNKAFLELAGAPVFTHVLASLEECASVDRIYLVGPRASLEAALERPDIPYKGRKPIKVMEQWENLYLNVWNAFLVVLDDQNLQDETSAKETSVLVVPSDIPLTVPEEVEEFIQACDMERFDYVVGITSGEVLSRYYPQRRRKGIRLMCFQTREGSYRQNNLHMVKPLCLMNRHYVQKIYDYRLQREWGNILRLLWEIFRTEEGTLRVVGQYLLLHLAAILYKVPKLGLHRIPASLNSMAGLQRSISNILGTRFSNAETHYGGAALDIDTPEHYVAIQENFLMWRRMQREGIQASRGGGSWEGSLG